MAKVIEFYIPDRLRERRFWSSPEQRRKVIEFPPTEVTGVASWLNGAKPPSYHGLVKKTTRSRFSPGRFPRTKSQYIRSMI